MAKLRRGKKKIIATEKSESVVAQFKTPWFKSLPKKQTAGVVIVASAVILISATLVIIDQRNDNKVPIQKIMTEEQALKDSVSKLKSNPPADNASVEERAAYFRDLSFALADTQDYKGAVAAVEEQVALKTDNLVYNDYILFAEYYFKSGNKEEALKALDKAMTLVNPTADPINGYNPQMVKDLITSIKQEYSK